MMPAVRLRVGDQSQIAAARRAGQATAETMGFDATQAGRLAIVVTELATNLLLHGGGGTLLLVPNEESTGLAVVAADRGPGIRDIARARRDGVSTAGSSGNGLGAVARLSSQVDVHSTLGAGTVVVARLGARPPADVDGLALPLEGESACGDSWGAARLGPVLSVLLADGLGHGDEAARASATAVRELDAQSPPEAQIERMHAALKSTRGAAGTVVRLDAERGTLRMAGVGNVAATIVTRGRQKVLPSMNGTLGGRIERVNAWDYPVEPGTLVVLHSDGLRGGWDLGRHPGAFARDPLTIAALLVRDNERTADDVSAVVLRVPETPG